MTIGASFGSGNLMGWFNFFRKRTSSVPLPQLCYDIAYFILPQYVHGDLPKFERMCQTPASVGPFLYVMACKMRGVEPDVNTATKFQLFTGGFADGRKYTTLAYPPPPPFDMSKVSPESLMDSPPVLAPHFSCVQSGRAGKVTYYVLGQAPFGGGTTLRCITADGANCSLGPGPTPTLEGFHSAVAEKADA